MEGKKCQEPALRGIWWIQLSLLSSEGLELLVGSSLQEQGNEGNDTLWVTGHGRGESPREGGRTEVVEG